MIKRPNLVDGSVCSLLDSPKLGRAYCEKVFAKDRRDQGRGEGGKG